MVFRKWIEWLKRRLHSKEEDSIIEDLDIDERQVYLRELYLKEDLEKNIKEIEKITGSSIDYSIRCFKIGKRIPGAIIYIDGLCDTRTIEEILEGLLKEEIKRVPSGPEESLKVIIESLLIVESIKEVHDLFTLFKELTDGKTALLINGSKKAILCDTRGMENRTLNEPDAEKTIRGPRDGFIEDIRTNTSLIRRRIRSPHLWIENMEVGELTQTKVEIAYLKGLAREDIITEVRNRIERIDIDGILESGYIEELIEDNPYTVFPLMIRTERTDKVASALLEGRIALFTAGSPHVLILPTELPTMLQAPDDYYELTPLGTFIRVIRMLSLIISLLLPGFYVAIINFHQELLPTTLLLRMTAAREGVPFPVIVEILILEFLFEVLREAGIRLPAAIGQAISIVGALILGDAAIRAGLVSPAVVIVIALTAIASFSTPIFSLGIAIRILRFLFTLLAASFGLFGLQFGLFLLITHLCSLRSFGVPYLSPFAPFILEDMPDNVIRFWWWGLRRRPKLLGARDPVRQDSSQNPRAKEETNSSRKGE